MIEIESSSASGVNIIYPAFLKKIASNFPVIDLNRLIKFSPYFVLMNSAITISSVLASGEHEAKMLDAISIILLLYISLRAALQRKMKLSIGIGPYKFRIARSIVWLNHISTGGMFFIFLNKLAESTDSTGESVGLRALSAVFILYTALPVLNYISYKQIYNNRNSAH